MGRVDTITQSRTKDQDLLYDALSEIDTAVWLLGQSDVSGGKGAMYGALPHIERAISSVCRYQCWRENLPAGLNEARRRLALAFSGIEQADGARTERETEHCLAVARFDLRVAIDGIWQVIDSRGKVQRPKKTKERKARDTTEAEVTI